MAHMVFCTSTRLSWRAGRTAVRLRLRPEIYKNVSKKAWGEWVERQKMLLKSIGCTWTREAQDFWWSR